jgi:hypothetical protein
VIKFNADGPACLFDRKRPGQPPRLNNAHRSALVKAIADGPIPAILCVNRRLTSYLSAPGRKPSPISVKTELPQDEIIHGGVLSLDELLHFKL